MPDLALEMQDTVKKVVPEGAEAPVNVSLLPTRDGTGSVALAPTFKYTSKPGAPPSPPHSVHALEANSTRKLTSYVAFGSMPSLGVSGFLRKEQVIRIVNGLEVVGPPGWVDIAWKLSNFGDSIRHAIY